ncbi:MAG: hypothetical protein CUN55_06445 [Phototrophicales bacterium]|nr:MAG: hypothetical protein CUN55_06445 [Phototrophicales bacterium]
MQHLGRLAIFSPDGPIQNFFIEKEIVAIGRSSGNDLVLDRHGISRYHASLTLNETGNIAELRDLESVNGTYVDGLRLKPNEARILRGGEEIQIGDIRLIFHPAADDTSDQTVQVHLQDFDAPHLSVALEGPDIAVTPGTHAPAIIRLSNKTQEKMRVVLRIEGVPPQWARLDQTEFELLPEQQREIGINFKPARRYDTKPGFYNITLHVGTVDTNYPPIELRTRLQILQFNGYGAVLGTPLIENEGIFKLYIHNQGNGPLPLRFLGRDAENLLNYVIEPSQIVLEAGQRLTVQGQVSAKQRPLLGKPQRINYDILTQSLSPSAFIAPVSGQIEIAPALSNWKLPIGIGVVLFLALLVLLGVLSSQMTSDSDSAEAQQPQISRFALNGNQSDNLVVSVNDPILVQWQTQNAAFIRLNAQSENGDTVLYTLAAQVPHSHVLQFSDVGRYAVWLEAQNEEKQEFSPMLNVEVLPLIQLKVYSVSTSTTQASAVLYRGVNGQYIIVEWKANWGNKTVPSPLDIIIGDQVFPITDMEGQLSLAANGLQNQLGGVEVSLEANSQILHTVILPTAYPECISQNDILLYDAPDPNSSAIPIMANTPFQIDGQNNERWIRVISPTQQTTIGYWGWLSPESLIDIICPIDYVELEQIPET